MGEKEFGYSHGIDCFGTRNDDYPLRKAMVDHDQDRVFPTNLREGSDEVYQDLFEGQEGGRRDRVQWRFGGMGIHFVLLAYGATFDKAVDVCRKPRPPEVSFQESFGTKPSRMPQG